MSGPRHAVNAIAVAQAAGRERRTLIILNASMPGTLAGAVRGPRVPRPSDVQTTGRAVAIALPAYPASPLQSAPRNAPYAEVSTRMATDLRSEGRQMSRAEFADT